MSCGVLAEPHVVRQVGAQPVAAQGGQPGQAHLLLAAQLAGEARRLLGRLARPAVARLREQLVDPAFGTDLQHGQPLRLVRAQHQLERVLQRHLAAALLLPEQRQRLLDLLRLELDPLAAHLHPRLLQPRQRRELLRGQRLVTERSLPVILHQRLPAERGRPARLPGSAHAPPQPNPNPDLRLDRRNQYPEAVRLQQQRRLSQELVRLVHGQPAASRRRLAQAALERHKQPRRPAQTRQQPLLGLVEAAIEEARGGAALLPDLRGRHQQAGIVRRLQQVLHRPVRAGLGRLQAEADPKCLLRRAVARRLHPDAVLLLERGQLAAGKLQAGVRRTQRRDPGVGGSGAAGGAPGEAKHPRQVGPERGARHPSASASR